MIGKIEKVPLREIWENEAYDFTTWLQDNLDVLNNVLDFNLVNAEIEQPAGSFSVDILAEDDSGDPVIIENQLEKSDHNHLGKLITYLVAIGAKKAIWIVAEPRPEHINAINWLNESSSGNFYLFKIEGIKIGDSAPAPLLTLITGSSEETKEVGEKKKEISERHLLRFKFWEELLKKAKEKTKLHSNISPSRYNWLSTGAGKSGLGFNYGITKNKGRVELYIDRGKDSEKENKEIFDQLYENKAEIEKTFGKELNWDRLDERRASSIYYKIIIGGYRDEERYPEIQEAMIDAMIQLEKSLRPFISKLKI
jgi:hypothetical protein